MTATTTGSVARTLPAATEPVTNPGTVGFAWGIQIAVAHVRGWETFVLLDSWPAGGRRPIAFLDEAALSRIHDQAGEALRRLRREAG